MRKSSDLFALLQLDGNDLLFSIPEYFNLHPVTALEFLERVQKIVFVIHGLTRDAYHHITQGDLSGPSLSKAPPPGGSGRRISIVRAAAPRLLLRLSGGD